MPGLVVFNRRWGIASDDFVFPGLFELFIRVLWYVSGCLPMRLDHVRKQDRSPSVLLDFS
ncbi:unnamed protein product [Tetraodon nigroviridis]|uniref:Chromosome undetermined SCAF14694, whole genome shotgun sequence n=1 Tax=Tetraodon nigroviridis TaxID=99883 RepID=Q4S9W8_TETNG|nr:unnamed protein product [Tetraodon nigroviridis]